MKTTAILFALPLAAALPDEMRDFANSANGLKELVEGVGSIDIMDVLRGPANGMGGRRLSFDLDKYKEDYKVEIDKAKDLLDGALTDAGFNIDDIKDKALEAFAQCEEIDFSKAAPVLEIISAFVADTDCSEQVLAFALTAGTGGNAIKASCAISNECLLTYGAAAQELALIAADSFEEELAKDIKTLADMDLDKLVQAKSLVCMFVGGSDAASRADTIEKLKEVATDVLLPKVAGFADAAEWLNPDKALELIAMCPNLKDSDKVKELLEKFDFEALKASASVVGGDGAAAAKLAEAIEKARTAHAGAGVTIPEIPEDVKVLLDAKLNEILAKLDASAVKELFAKCAESDVELSSSRLVLSEAQTAELSTEQVAAFEKEPEATGGNGAASASGSLALSAVVAAAFASVVAQFA